MIWSGMKGGNKTGVGINVKATGETSKWGHNLRVANDSFHCMTLPKRFKVTEMTCIHRNAIAKSAAQAAFYPQPFSQMYTVHTTHHFVGERQGGRQAET